MSYCRFSSDNWRSDVYVYADVSGGWTTHVAGRRRLIPPIPDFPLMSLPDLGGKYDRETRRMVYPNWWRKGLASVLFGAAAFWHNRMHMGSLRMIPLRPIGGPHDGESFRSAEPGECAALLLDLRRAGYYVPQYAIDGLHAEAAEELAPSGLGGIHD